MDEMMLASIVFAAAVALLVYALMPKRESRKDALKRRLESDEDEPTPGVGSTRQADEQTWRRMGRTLKRTAPFLARPAVPTTEAERTRLRTKLAQAGLRRESAAMIFLASKSALGLAVAGGVFFWAWRSHQTTLNLVALTVGSASVAFLAPNFWLSLRIRSRAQKISRGLSDALDMMVIMVEAGLGLDAAIQRAGMEMAFSYPELAEELRVTNSELNMGIPRPQAMDNLAIRTGIKEVRTLVAVIVQADRFGSGIAKTLRIQASTLRTKRQQAAEENAQKTSLKLIFPLVLFIFPALMVVIGGPAVMHLIESFGSM